MNNHSAHPITLAVKVTLQAVAIPEPDGGYSIVVPALRGCVSQADTVDETQANVVEAAEGWLASMHDRYAADAVRAATEPLDSELQPAPASDPGTSA